MWRKGTAEILCTREVFLFLLSKLLNANQLIAPYFPQKKIARVSTILRRLLLFSLPQFMNFKNFLGLDHFSGK